MDYKQYFIKNKINNIESFFKYTRDGFKYGWMDQNNNFHKGVNSGKTYCLQRPDELIKNRIGICWDMTELCRCWFSLMTQFKYETYYIFYDDNMGCPSHSILVFYNNDSVFWFEPMFNNENFYYSGIHKYSNIYNLLNDVKRVFIKNAILKEAVPKKYDDSKIYLYKYSKPQYHINGYEMRNHIDNSIIMLSVK